MQVSMRFFFFVCVLWGVNGKLVCQGSCENFKKANCHQKVIFGDNLLFGGVLCGVLKENGRCERLPIYG